MPVEMISVCDAEGQLRPLRFRFEDAAHRLHTVRVSEVVTSKEINYVGLQSYLYVCRALSQGREIVLELRYLVKAHRWVLFRMLG